MTRTQIKHLLYKEWIKTRWYAAVGLVGSLILSVYACIDAVSTFHDMGGTFFYSTLLTGNIALMTQLKYLPLAIALLIGLPQFLPEITNKRIRLTLHLPVGCTAVVYTMVLYGLAVFCCTLLPALLITVITLAVSFPAEVTVATLQTLLPWLLSFAAGAMLFVVVEELIPEANLCRGGHGGTLGVMAGFLIMMILDVALG